MSPGQDRTMPAEWARHDATWLAWPHNVRDWPGKFGPVPWVYAEIIRRISAGEMVRLLVDDTAGEGKARGVLDRAGVNLAGVEFRRVTTDRSWIRDAGPIFVVERASPVTPPEAARRDARPAQARSRAGPLRAGVGPALPVKAIARFRFNAWARYPDFGRDARIPERAAKALGAPLVPVIHRGRGVVLEGGSVDVNGRGTILATEECLLDPDVQVRNPGFSRDDYEEIFESALGAPNAIWLGKGIAGDDTHGHVDDLARFVGPRTILLCREPDGRDANHRSLEENRERLEAAQLEDGSRPEVVFLPMPQPVIFEGRRLPASYANFYACNAAVLVPTFDDPADRVALGTLAELFRDRPVIGIHALDLVLGLGTLHCLSQQEPSVG